MRKLTLGETLRTALRILGYELVFGFIGFMLVPMLISASPILRYPLIGSLVVIAILLFFMDGSYRGERDVTMSETLDKLAASGGYTPTPQEEGKRYVPLKGILGALLGALPLFLCALYVAITAQPYAYSLQDLPSWLSSYMIRPEIGDALAYVAEGMPTASISDYLRIFVRFMLFPYVGLFGTMSDELSLLFDRIGPLLTLVMPVAAAIGYLFGPSRRAKAVKTIETAKRTPRKRLKKDRKRQTGPKEKKQLV